MIPAGQLDKRIRIERRKAGRDAIGQPVGDWELVADPWARILYGTGLQAIKAGAESSTVRASIRIRYREGIDAGMRVVHKETIYDIQAVLPDQGAGRIDLVCEVAK